MVTEHGAEFRQRRVDGDRDPHRCLACLRVEGGEVPQPRWAVPQTERDAIRNRELALQRIAHAIEVRGLAGDGVYGNLDRPLGELVPLLTCLEHGLDR